MNIKPMHIALAACAITTAGLFTILPVGEALIATGIMLFVVALVKEVGTASNTRPETPRPKPTPNPPPRKP